MQVRPRLTPEEYEIIKAYRNGKITVPPDITKTKHGAKILLFDIETAPIKGSVWSLWKQNMNIDFIESDWFMISWAAKWLDAEEIMSDIVTPVEVAEEDDQRISENLWELVDEADIVIAHNANKFDVKRINTRFLFHGMFPPSHYQVIDTLAVVRKRFAISSNRLDYISRWLGLEGKIETNAKLWSGCIAGDKGALEKMLDYNEQDVFILERNYKRVLAWIDNHPNLNLYNDKNVSVCNNCGSENIEWDGHKYTKAGKYPTYRCKGCGYKGHARRSILTKEKSQTLVK